MKLARAIIAGGGTGGHLFPGIAVAREIQRRNAAAEVLFVGAERGIGAFVLSAGNLYDTDNLLAGIVVLSLLGASLGFCLWSTGATSKPRATTRPRSSPGNGTARTGWRCGSCR